MLSVQVFVIYCEIDSMSGLSVILITCFKKKIKVFFFFFDKNDREFIKNGKKV